MLSLAFNKRMKSWKRQPKDGGSQFENRLTQPLKREKVFANPEVLPEGWYPITATQNLPKGAAQSFLILKQRVVVWRGQDGQLRALDAFCSHMGADLGNGSVIGNDLRCFFHHRKFNENGMVQSGSTRSTAASRLTHYPVRDYLGHVWVYAGVQALSDLIAPPGLENQKLHAVCLAEPTLFAHHHVMMAGGIDLLHFQAVHKIHIEFDFRTSSQGAFVHDWKLSGVIKPLGVRGRIGRFLLGDLFTYTLRLGAGSMVSITYGENQKLWGRFPLPQLHVVWGCMPQTNGVSKVSVFSVVRFRAGIQGAIIMRALHLLTLLLVGFLRDDDVKAFPHMRFQITDPLPEDKPVLQLIRAINLLPESIWTQTQLKPFANSVSNIGLSTTN